MRLRPAAILCTVALLAAAPVLALEPYLVKDINPIPLNQSSFPRSFVSLDNGIALFGANLSDGYPEMWRSDGTPGGTYQLTDTCTSWYCKTAVTGFALAGDRFFYLAATRPGDQNASELWVTGGSAIDTFDLGGPFYPDYYSAPVWVESRRLLFFLAHDGDFGIELWRSDGTAAGTYKLIDAQQGQPDSLTEHRGKLYFVSSASGRRRLWTSDGTSKGTKLVKDFSVHSLRSIGSALVFFNYDSKGWNFWRSDGTAKGTVKLATIAPGPPDMPIMDVMALAGRYYFTTYSTTQGEELWASDGTKAGTRRLTNFANKAVFHYDDFQPLYLPTLAVGSRMVFAADDGVHGAEPWVTDGTPAGTRLLRDVCPGSCWSWFSERATLGSRLIFAAASSAQGQEPWVTDGTPAGTRLLRDTCPGACNSLFFGMVELGGGLLFGADDGQNGLQLWKTNGTPRGTSRITTFPEDVSSVKRIGASISGGVLYSADSRQHGVELWRTDGTAAGTSMVLDLLDRDNGGGRPSGLFALGNRLIFLVDDGIHGRELWTSDGTEAGTRLVLDNDPDATRDSSIAADAEMDGIAFVRWYTNGRSGLWRTDGTAAGTFRLTPEEMTDVHQVVKTAANRLFFIGSQEEHGTKLWTSDGTVEGTRALDIQPSTGSYTLTPYREDVFFKVYTSGIGEQVWKSNGTPEGTVPVPFLGEGIYVLNTNILGEFNGRLWMSRLTDSFGHELWSTDGTEAGTRMLGDIAPESESFQVHQMIPAGSRMFLEAHGKLWVSDGTAVGTREIGPGPSREGVRPIVLNGRLFFAANVDSSYDLWASDGSESGTKRLPTADGERLVNPTNLVAFEGRLWFIQGGKIWSTDGTPAGTVAQVTSDPEEFTGERLTPAGGRLFFSGWTPQAGHELWALDPQ